MLFLIWLMPYLHYLYPDEIIIFYKFITHFKVQNVHILLVAVNKKHELGDRKKRKNDNESDEEPMVVEETPEEKVITTDADGIFTVGILLL